MELVHWPWFSQSFTAESEIGVTTKTEEGQASLTCISDYAWNQNSMLDKTKNKKQNRNPLQQKVPASNIFILVLKRQLFQNSP